MPIECSLLENAPIPFTVCPKCGAAPFDPFLRGQVQRSFFSLTAFLCYLKRERYPYCALICHECKEIVGYE